MSIQLVQMTKVRISLLSYSLRLLGILKKFELVIHGTGDDQWTEDDRNLRGTDSNFDSFSESSDQV